MMLALLLAAAAAPEQPARTPEAFVEHIYAGYRDPDYSPLARPERIFAAPMAAAIREDQRLSHDEVGFIDADPLCQCQDPSGLEPRIGEVRRTTSRTASARILLRFGSTDDRELRLDLVRTAAGWRVADLGTPDSASMLRDLRHFNRRRR